MCISTARNYSFMDVAKLEKKVQEKMGNFYTWEVFYEMDRV